MANVNITAVLQVQGPVGLSQVVQNIQRGLKGIDASINLTGGQQAIANLGALNARLLTVSNSLRQVQADATNAAAAIATIASALNRAGGTSAAFASNTRTVAAVIKDAAVNSHEAAQGIDKFASQTGLAARRFTGFTLAAGAIASVVFAIKSGVSQAVEFERQMARVQQVTGQSDVQIGRLAGSINRISTELGASSADLAQAAVQFGRLSLAGRDLDSALEAVGKASLSATFNNIAEATDQATTLMRQFGVQAKDLESTMGGVAGVSQKFALEAKDVTDVLRTSGAVFKQTGGDVNELVSIFAAAKGQTGQAANAIAASLNLIFVRLQKGSTVEGLKELGVELRYTREQAQALGEARLEGQFVGAYESVRRLSQALSGLRQTDPRYSAILEELGGAREVSKAIPVIQQFGEAQKALNVAQASSIKLSADAEKAQATLSGRTAILGQRFHELVRNIVTSDSFQGFADKAIKLANAFLSLADSLRPLIPLFTAFAAVKLGQAFAQSFAGSGPFSFFAKSFLGERPKGVKPFAVGGVVPGSGDSDSVHSLLTPGEYVIKKSSARAIGYDNLEHMNQGGYCPPGEKRYASGGQAAKWPWPESMYASGGQASGKWAWPDSMYAGGGKVRYAEGGVVTRENVLSIIKEFEEKTGIKTSKLVAGINFSRKAYGKFAATADTKYLGEGEDWLARPGAYSPKTQGIHLNPDAIADVDQLRYTLFHELGHAADNFVSRQGGNKGFASTYRGNALSTYGRRESRLRRIEDVTDFNFPTGRERDYRYSRAESFADTFAAHVGGDNAFDPLRRLNRRGFQASVIDPIARATNPDYEKGLGFFGRLKRGVSSFFSKFAEGGLASYPQGRRASYEDLAKSINDKFEKTPLYAHGPDYTHQLARLSLTPEVLEKIPAGSKFIGSGVVGLAFRSPDGEVIRVQAHAAAQKAIDRLRGYKRELSPLSVSTDRPKVEGILQASASGNVGDVFVERLPYVPSVGSLNWQERKKAIEKVRELRDTLGKQGYDLVDRHVGNIGILHGKAVVIDPGAAHHVLGSTDRTVSPDPAVNQNARTAKYASGGEIFRRYAPGGHVGGEGNEDKVPALLTPGEYVLSNDAVSRVGKSNVDYLNKFGKLPGFARGGLVGYAKGGKVKPDDGTFEIKSSYGQLGPLLVDSGVRVGHEEDKGSVNEFFASLKKSFPDKVFEDSAQFIVTLGKAAGEAAISIKKFEIPYLGKGTNAADKAAKELVSPHLRSLPDLSPAQKKLLDSQPQELFDQVRGHIRKKYGASRYAGGDDTAYDDATIQGLYSAATKFKEGGGASFRTFASRGASLALIANYRSEVARNQVYGGKRLSFSEGGDNDFGIHQFADPQAIEPIRQHEAALNVAHNEEVQRLLTTGEAKTRRRKNESTRDYLAREKVEREAALLKARGLVGSQAPLGVAAPQVRLPDVLESTAPVAPKAPAPVVPKGPEDLLTQLARTGVHARGAGLKDETLSGLLRLSSLIPPEARQLLNASGSFSHVAPGGVPEFLGPETTAKSPVFQLPGLTGVAIPRGFGKFSDQSVVSNRAATGDVERLATGGRSVLLHERGHDIDRLFGQLFQHTGVSVGNSVPTNFRLSGLPQFKDLHAPLSAALAGRLAPEGATRIAKDPQESFAEGIAAHLQGGEARQALPPEANEFFERIFLAAKFNAQKLLPAAASLAPLSKNAKELPSFVGGPVAPSAPPTLPGGFKDEEARKKFAALVAGPAVPPVPPKLPPKVASPGGFDDDEFSHEASYNQSVSSYYRSLFAAKAVVVDPEDKFRNVLRKKPRGFLTKKALEKYGSGSDNGNDDTTTPENAGALERRLADLKASGQPPVPPRLPDRVLPGFDPRTGRKTAPTGEPAGQFQLSLAEAHAVQSTRGISGLDTKILDEAFKDLKIFTGVVEGTTKALVDFQGGVVHIKGFVNQGTPVPAPVASAAAPFTSTPTPRPVARTPEEVYQQESLDQATRQRQAAAEREAQQERNATIASRFESNPIYEDPEHGLRGRRLSREERRRGRNLYKQYGGAPETDDNRLDRLINSRQPFIEDVPGNTVAEQYGDVLQARRNQVVVAAAVNQARSEGRLPGQKADLYQQRQLDAVQRAKRTRPAGTTGVSDQELAERQEFLKQFADAPNKRAQFETPISKGRGLPDDVKRQLAAQTERRRQLKNQFNQGAAGTFEIVGPLQEAPPDVNRSRLLGVGTTGQGLLDRTTRSVIDSRGGEASLSTVTKLAIRQDQEIAIKQQLITAEERLLAAILPNVPAVERHKIALDRSRDAWEQNQRVVQDLKGHILGTQRSLDEVAKTGKNPAQVARGGRYERFVGDNVFPAAPAGGQAIGGGPIDPRQILPGRTGLKGAYDRFAGGITGGFGQLNDRFNKTRVGQFLGSGFGSSAVFGASIALPYLSQGIEGLGGDVEAAAKGSGTKYTAAKGASGLLSGAAVGAIVGSSILPGLGTAVGAVAGGLLGLASSLNEAEKEIRQVRIGNALTTFGDKLQGLANGVSTTSSVASAKDSLREYQSLSLEKNRKESTGYLLGFDPKEFVALQQKSARQDFGGQLPALTQALARQADEIGRANVGKNLDQLSRELEEGNGGLNRTFLSIIAQVRGVSIGDVLKEQKKNIQVGQRSAISDKLQLEDRRANEGSVNSFGRLVLAVQGAADSLTELHQVSHSLNEAFDGLVGVTKVTSNGEALGQLGRQDRGALEPLNTIAAVGGEGGERLRRAGTAADLVSGALPGVLAQLASQKDLTQDDVATRTRRGLEASLGSNVNDDTRKAITSVIANLNKDLSGEGGLTKVLRSIEIDTTKFSESLTASFNDPVKEAGQRISKELDEQGNSLISGLARYAEMVRRQGEGLDRVSNLQLREYRQRIEFDAERNNNRHGVLDNVPLENLQFDFRQRQERLTGVRGPQANDPAFIGRQLAATNRGIEQATVRQNQAFAASGGKPDGPFRAAADELLRLKGRAADLQAALQHLTEDVRNAGAAEKLRGIEGDRQGRQGLAERFATADAGQLAQLNRALALANEANNNPKAFDDFTAEDRRSTLDLLRGAGNTKLEGFKGSPHADTLVDRLLTQFQGGAFGLSKDSQTEQEGLRKSIEEANKTAVKAQEELVKAQGQVSEKFLTDLEQTQNRFFGKLEQFFARDRLSEKKNELATKNTEVTGLKDLAGQRDVLNKFGVTQDAQVKAVKANPSALSDLLAAQNSFAELSPKSSAAGLAAAKDLAQNTSRFRSRNGENINALTSAVVVDDYKLHRPGFLDALSKQGGLPGGNINPDEAERIFTNFTRSAKDRLKAAGIDAGLDQGSSLTNNPKAQGIIESALANATNAELTSRRSKGLYEAREQASQKFEDATGVKPNLSLLSTPESLEAFKKAIDRFSAGESLGTLDERLKKASADLDGLSASVGRLQKVVDAINVPPPPVPGQPPKPGQPEVHALGGPAGTFRPSGTDTVPAMLTPGEFVIKKSAAQKNYKLLKEINEGRAGYASGGLVGYAYGGMVSRYADGGDVDAEEVANAELRETNRRRREAAGKPSLKELADAREQAEARERASRRHARELANRGPEQLAEDAENEREHEKRNREREEADRNARRAFDVGPLVPPAPPANPNAADRDRDEADRNARRAFDVGPLVPPAANPNRPADDKNEREVPAANAADVPNFNFRPVRPNPVADIHDLAADIARRKAEAARGKVAEPEVKSAAEQEREIQRDLLFQALSNRGGSSAGLIARTRVAAVVESVQGRLRKNDDLLGVQDKRAAAYKKAGGRDRFEQLQRDSVAGVAGYLTHLGGEAANLSRRQNLANAQDSGAAFGLGRGDFGTQQGLAANQLQQAQSLQNEANRRETSERSARAALVQPQVVTVPLRKPKPEVDGLGRKRPGQRDENHALGGVVGLQGFANGGWVPGMGMTDSVPALLTPGEYVLPRSVASRYADGGQVGGGQQTGNGGGGDGFAQAFSGFSTSVTTFGSAATALASSLNGFTNNATALSKSLDGMPRTLTVDGQQHVTVTINGADVLASLTPDLQKMVSEQVTETVRRVFKEKLPDANVNV